ncbi:MAG: PPC domain-containing protein, partial [Verrucomicrobiae bacterium]|nr:PPC domain-containing protein [Verrucomicrobiae bacterium]
SVMLPVVINGKISSDEDVDSFRFYAKGGEKVVVEVFARRLNSPLDSIVHLVDGNGDVVAANDDYEDKGSGLTTHHADSYLIATIPRDGIYYARISSAQRQGGDDYVYRLRISKPKPDFEIRMAPSELNLRQGGCNDLTVYALRKDGFDGDIWLSIKDAPSGFRLDGGRIPPGRDKVRVTISSPPRRFVEPVRVLLQASALINGKTVVRDVVASKEMVQAFAYHHLVPVNDFFVYVRSVNPQRAPVKLLSPLPVRIRPGFTARVSFEGPPLLKEFANLALSEPPEGIVLKNVVATRYGFDLVLYADREKVKPGLEDNLIVEMSPRPILQANQTASSSLNRRRINAGALPAIPIIIVP